MKRTLFTFFWLTAIILFGTRSYAQRNNTLSIVYGTGSDGLISISKGAPGFAGEGFNMFGLDYIMRMDGLFSIETGVEYSNNDLLLNYIDVYDPTFKPQKTSIKMVSVPVYGNFTFFKYLFLNAGVSVDIETDHSAESIAPGESGIGVFLGVGGKYNFRNITLSVNPFVQVHGLLPFSSSGGQSLTNSGFKLGIGYGF